MVFPAVLQRQALGKMMMVPSFSALPGGELKRRHYAVLSAAVRRCSWILAPSYLNSVMREVPGLQSMFLMDKAQVFSCAMSLLYSYCKSAGDVLEKQGTSGHYVQGHCSTYARTCLFEGKRFLEPVS